MTATDELRRLLDERGVEYEVDDAKTVRVTRWRAYGDWVSFIEYDNGDTKFCIDARRLTPAQAIAATLGSFTVQATERISKDTEKDSDGHGTCHDTHESRWFHCSECGFGLCDLYVDAPWHEYDQPKHCPNCGRRIKEPAMNLSTG